MSENLDGIIRKVTALIARADHPSTPPAEASACRDKADALMFKYKIETLTTPETKSLASTPVWKDIFLCRVGNEWRNHYYSLAAAVLDRQKCRYQWESAVNPEDGKRYYILRAVGLESDIAYAQVLVMSAIAAFGHHLEPKPDPSEDFDAACLRLRRGGMERRRITLALLGGWSTENEMKAKNRKVTQAIKREAARIGQPHLADELLGRGNNIKTYRDSYAGGFLYTLRGRLRDNQRDEALNQHAVVLASAKDAVDEAFYTRYPHLRPKAVIDASSYKTRADCPKCAKAKSGYCREHQWLKPRAFRETAYSAAGSRAGSAAARSVDLKSFGGGALGA